MPRKIRVLVGKPGLDGHDRGAKVVAAALRDAGMEVIYTGLHQTPEQIVEAGVQEDVDVLALSILSGAHMTLFPEVLSLMRERGIGDTLLTGGGIVPAEDMATLAAMGVGRLFGPGSSTQDIVAYIREWFGERHGAEALDPLPPPPVPRPMDLSAGPAPEPAPRRSAAPSRAAKPAKTKRATKRAAPAKPKRAKAATRRARPGAKRATKRAKPAKAKRARPPAPKRATAKRAKAAPGKRGAKKVARRRAGR